MAWCAAVGCINFKAKNRNLTFFNLPREKDLAAKWKAKIKRENLPKKVYLCEEHFEEQCFDRSVDLQNQLLPGKCFPSFANIPEYIVYVEWKLYIPSFF